MIAAVKMPVLPEIWHRLGGCSQAQEWLDTHGLPHKRTETWRWSQHKAFGLENLALPTIQPIEPEACEASLWSDHPFLALNAAGVSEYRQIKTQDGDKITLEYTCIAGALQQPRTLLHVPDHTHVVLEEQFNGDGFCNAVIFITLGEAAQLTHHRRVQNTGTLITLAVVQSAPHARYNSLLEAYPQGVTRIETDIAFHGNGAEANCDGVVKISGEANCDHHSIFRHHASHTQSQQRYRSVTNDSSTSLFQGLIEVAHGTAGVNATLRHDGLLLSRSAQINTKPELAIYAQDVKCAHGATVGQLDKDALFYLTARGLSQEVATEMLIEGFLAEIFNSHVGGEL